MERAGGFLAEVKKRVAGQHPIHGIPDGQDDENKDNHGAEVVTKETSGATAPHLRQMPAHGS